MKHWGKVVQQWKSYTSRKVLEYFTLKQQNYLLDELRFLKGTLARGQEDRERTTHRVWQTGYHPQIIDEEHLWQQKADYITHNPVKRGLVVAPEDWRFSWAHEWRKGARPVMQVDPWFPQNPKE